MAQTLKGREYWRGVEGAQAWIVERFQYAPGETFNLTHAVMMLDFLPFLRHKCPDIAAVPSVQDFFNLVSSVCRRFMEGEIRLENIPKDATVFQLYHQRHLKNLKPKNEAMQLKIFEASTDFSAAMMSSARKALYPSIDTVDFEIRQGMKIFECHL